MRKKKQRLDIICDICWTAPTDGMTWTEKGTQRQYCRDCMGKWFPDAKPIKPQGSGEGEGK